MNTKLTLCVDSRMINSSGIGIYIRNIIPFLKLEYDLILLGDVLELESFGVKMIGLSSKIYSVSEQIELCQKIPKCDVFWSPHYNIPLLPIKARKRIVTIHDVYHLAYSSKLSLFQKIYSKVMINSAAVLSNRIVTVSEFSKSEIIKYTKCNYNKIKVIYNGVKQSALYNDDLDLQAKYGVAGGKYILFVGLVKPHKNLRRFLEAFTLLPKALYDEYQVVIVGKKDGMITGDPELFEWAKDTAHIMDKITFTGHVDDVDIDTIYKNASLFVFPSIYEGFGLPPLEAMLNNCPVIASNAASIPEVCGDAVLYFDPFDVHNISGVMSNVFLNEELRLSLSLAGTGQVKKFKWSNAGMLHKQLIQDLYQ